MRKYKKVIDMFDRRSPPSCKSTRRREAKAVRRLGRWLQIPFRRRASGGPTLPELHFSNAERLLRIPFALDRSARA